MRILYFHQHFTLPSGYHPARSARLACALAGLGHKVCVVSGFGQGGDGGTVLPFATWYRRSLRTGYCVAQSEIKYSNYMEPASRTKSFLLYALLSLSFALRSRANIVFATSTPLTVVFPMLCAKVFLGAKCVFEARDRWPKALVALNAVSARVARILGFLELSAVLSADVTVGVAPGAVAGFRELGKRPRKMFLVPNFSVREELITNASDRTKNFEEILVVYFGAHGYANGLDALLHAAKQVYCVAKHIKFILVGDGSQKDRLISIAQKEKVLNIAFIDPVPAVRLQTIFMQADIAVHCLAPGAGGGDSASPNKIFEAMSAGLPVVTNWRGWLSKRIVEAGAGVIVDVEAFASTVVELARDDQRRAEMGRRGKLLAASEFSALEQVKRLCDVVEYDLSARML